MIEIMKASAGSGKTFNLARKYIALLLENKDRHAYRHILAVTFTNKATDEMKSRILRELYILSTEPMESGYRNDFVPALFDSHAALKEAAETVLYNILHDYSAFSVSTIDRFFQQTLKAFTREIGQFASYQVELDRDSLVKESVDRILDTLSEDNPDLLHWLTDNVLEQIESGERYSMDANLLQMALRLESPEHRQKAADCGIDVARAYSKKNLSAVRKKCREIRKDFETAVSEAASGVLRTLAACGVDPAESNRRFMTVLYDYANISEGEKVTAPTPAFMSKAGNPDEWFAKSKAAGYLPSVAGILEEPLERFCGLFGKDFEVYNTALILDSQIYGLGVAAELFRTFESIMKEKNVLCIDDSNTILKNIIDGSDAPFVYEKLGVRFEHFLLDEFQDTSRVQWDNFSPLVHNSDSQGFANLVVGDVKQSIYRWRGSDWGLLHERLQEEFDSPVLTSLDSNYRSLGNIVAFNNVFFKEAAAVLDRLSGESGAGSAGEIYSSAEQKTASPDEQKGSVSLTFCPKDAELQEILNVINGLVEKGALLSDIAILVRSNSTGGEVASCLTEAGISIISDDSLSVKKSVTVRKLVSLMSYMDNPSDTVKGYLASSLGLGTPVAYNSLADLAESLLRVLVSGGGLPEGEAAYVQSFMDILLDYASSNGNNLRGFLKFWDTETPSISSPSSGNAVRIMTIHKAKGLDFPYVIIPFVENICLYKAGPSWCRPDTEGTALEGIADGIFDVTLSSASISTLFADNYYAERRKQFIDNINILYVAMTRAAKGMHIIGKTPSAKIVSAAEKGEEPQFSDFSQILYWFAKVSGFGTALVRTASEDVERFDFGVIYDFGKAHAEKARTGLVGKETEELAPAYPSYPYIREGGEGRLRAGDDCGDFFSEEGAAGIDASRRIRGVIMHDILSNISVCDDLKKVVEEFAASGRIDADEAESIYGFLSERIMSAKSRGWFPDDRTKIRNESTLIDDDGKLYRPDRVVFTDDGVVIVDYKFGARRAEYVRQVSKYADLFRRMGYKVAGAWLWYVDTDEVTA